MASKSSQASPKSLTKAYLERVALWYLERYGGSSKRLRAALTRRLGKRLVTDEAQALAWIDEVVEQVQAAGYQDDARWAEAKVQRWLSQGHSPLSIRQRLRQEGIPTVEIDALLPQAEAAALDAALTYVRKRRLGHWRAAEVRAAYHQKDLAALARRGFSYGLALKALAGEADSSG